MRAQFYPRVVVLLLSGWVPPGCSTPSQPTCPQLSAALTATEAGPATEISSRVDAALVAARGSCGDLAKATADRDTIAFQLARAKLADAHPDAALAELRSLLHPAIALQRAELLDRMHRTREAAAALAPALAVDANARDRFTLLRVSAAAAANDAAGVARAIAAAPAADRPRLAHRAVADADASLLDVLAHDDAELAAAVGERLEQAKGPAAARTARERAVVLEPDVADHWDALGRARIASGAIDDALAAWDRASAIAPAQPAYRIAPVQALVIAGERERAKQRANALAEVASASADVELVVTASNAAAAAGDTSLGIKLSRLARSRRPSDGRLAFLVGQRLAEAGDTRASAETYAELLICGAHARPWHRHEVAARLVALGDRALVRDVLAAKRSCEPIDPADLATYVSRLSSDSP
jgi:hypothetical protein